MTAPRIHILGASGSGTTTLGAALASRLGIRHLDVDDYYWMPTAIPFQHPRPLSDRQRRLSEALAGDRGWILSGSLCGWGDFAMPFFDLVIFLTIPRALRMMRLAAREASRFGASIEPGGEQYDEHRDFMEWAARYDEAGHEQRSRELHEAWLTRLASPILRLDGDLTTEERLATILDRIASSDLSWRESSIGDAS